MKIERITDMDEALVAAVAHLVPQLSPGREPPGLLELSEMVAQPGTNLLLARDGDAILGMLTLLVHRIPTGLKARIDAVVVDAAARGRGVGAALTEEALRLADGAGVRVVELTSSPSREAANRLYRRLGFEQRETNVYVWRPQ